MWPDDPPRIPTWVYLLGTFVVASCTLLGAVVTVLPEILDRYDNRTAPGISTPLDSEEQPAAQVAPTQIIVSTISAENNSQSAPPQVISNCPIYEVTGQGKSLDLSIDVPSGEIVFIDAWTFDTTSSGVFVTITGPYQGEHTIIDGAYCGGVNASANYQPLLEQRRSQLSAPYMEINLP
jgi:hypothetical protein